MKHVDLGIFKILLDPSEFHCNVHFTAHKNVKVFISHCGLLGSQEAMYHATPIIGMPLIGDQPRNIIKWQSKGVGRALYWDELTEELMTETINDVMNNPK